jgi:DNA primase
VLFNLDRAKEHIRALDYAILVEGQMDCISVFSAGFKNVVASSGTAFTEAQVRLLARYSKRVVVNFDPDAAGAAATERSLALLVSEDFAIKVLTLDPGLDPDLFIRKKGREAYAAALKSAPEYFEHLIERARANFRVNTPDGKVKAVNFLLPHLQRVQSHIKRDELAAEMAYKLGIDSAVLRQALKHAVAGKRQELKAFAHVQITHAEKILLRALSSEGELRERVLKALSCGELEHALDSAALAQALIEAATPHDLGSLAIADSDRTLLAGVLMDESEELTPGLVEKALAALRRKQLERRQRQLKHDIAEAERKRDQSSLAQLMQEKVCVDRALAAQN